MSESEPASTGVKVTLAPDSIEMPQLRPTTKGTLEPKTVGRPVLADYTLGVNVLVDMDNVAETIVMGVKLFPHRDKVEQYHLAEVYVLGGPVGGDVGYMGSLALCRVDFPGGGYDIKYDDEVVRQVRDLVFPGPKAFK
ncbi:MAG TPA: hypothetical protein VHF22_04585 [Planctomycetota bacterium]|nr:hypothetical protein [Planctomycetota bacterium]